MPLLSRVASIDTIDEFESAYPDRLRDARFLREGRSYWAVYTFGYVVEIVLKTAYARLHNWAIHADVWPLVRSAPNRAVLLNLTRTARNLHDLLFWADLLVAERLSRAIPFSVGAANTLIAHVGIVAANWREDLRYRDSLDARVESQQVSSAVDWLVQHYPAMWR